MLMAVERKKRDARADIYRKIAELLREGSYNILQISEKTGINWETVRNAVDTLSKIGLISSKEENGKTYYYMDESKMLNLREDTLLGLPITKDQEELTKGLCKRIIQRWEKLGIQKTLNKTFLQKILIKVIKTEKIQNVPYGWYIFGECAVLQYDASIDSKYDIGTKYDKSIDSVIKDYSRFEGTKELLLNAYSDNELYQLRLKISELLKDRFTTETIESLKKNIRLFILSFKMTQENEEVIEFVNGFASIYCRLANGLSIGQMEDLREDINASFMSVWEIMGTYNLYESLSEKGFDKSILKKYYLLRLQNLKQVADCYLSTLQEFCPELVPANDPLRRFKGIQAA